MPSMSIGQVARAAGVGVETIRFYEREHLIPEPPRRPSGYRQYPHETVQRLAFIRRAKALGFTLKEVRELLDLRVRDGEACDSVRANAEAKIVEVKSRIADLLRLKATLVELVSACNQDRATETCPILAALEGGEDDGIG